MSKQVWVERFFEGGRLAAAYWAASSSSHCVCHSAVFCHIEGIEVCHIEGIEVCHIEGFEVCHIEGFEVVYHIADASCNILRAIFGPQLPLAGYRCSRQRMLCFQLEPQ